jgi:DNA-directed RNA polymerase subunit M/transcription elongation factor TFIIS
MNNNQYSTYIQQPYKFQVHPIQTCPICSHNEQRYQIKTTNDGNRHQECTTCGWKWTATN